MRVLSGVFPAGLMKAKWAEVIRMSTHIHSLLELFPVDVLGGS